MGEGEQAVDDREALIEMYKAGFLDAYKLKNKLKTDQHWKDMNKLYKLAFMKRFEQRVTETFEVAMEAKK